MTEDLSLSGLRNRFNQLIDLTANFVEFPRNITSGFAGAPGGAYYDVGFRNGVLIGGCWLAKYPMSRLDATPKSQGASSIPVSQPRVPAWTTVSWQEALEACRAMNRSDEQALTKGYVSGGGIDAGGADMNGYHYITIDTAAHFLELAVGNHIELAHTLTAAEVIQLNTGGNSYVNAIHTNTTTAPTVRDGGADEWVDTDVIIYERKVAKWDQENKKIFLTLPLPTDALGVADITAASPDTVSVRKYDLAGLEEGAAIKLECAMQAKAGSPFGADGYPKGNNDYGEDHDDADEWRFYGDNDPTYTAAGHEIYKVLCGSGPDSWYHDNNRKTGVWCYNGNVYDWLNAKVYDRKIQAGYPGEGFTFPNVNNFIATIEAAAVLCGAKDLALPITQAGAGVTEFGDDYAYLSYADDRAFRVGGYYHNADKAGVFGASIGVTPGYASANVGFRAAL
jgi:hypothetical protein